MGDIRRHFLAFTPKYEMVHKASTTSYTRHLHLDKHDKITDEIVLRDDDKSRLVFSRERRSHETQQSVFELHR